jgi:hypothetical protein
MVMTEELLLMGVAIVVQVAGLTSMAVARVCERRRRREGYQAFFLVCLLLVGFFTAMLISADSDYKLACAATLPLMVLGATLDMRSSRDDEVI